MGLYLYVLIDKLFKVKLVSVYFCVWCAISDSNVYEAATEVYTWFAHCKVVVFSVLHNTICGWNSP